MASVWIAPLAAIVGTIVGTLGSYTLQKRQWRREKEERWVAARREAYGKFLGYCNIYHSALLQAAGAVRHKRELPSSSFSAAWQLANSRKSEALATQGEVAVLADPPVKIAAHMLIEYLEQFNIGLHEHNMQGTSPEPDMRYREIYEKNASGFARVATESLGIAGERKPWYGRVLRGFGWYRTGAEPVLRNLV
jgi:hypothetical protein